MQTKVSKWKLDTGTMHIFFLCQGSVAPYNSVQCLAPTALPKTQSFGHRCFQFFSPGWAPVSPLQRLLGTFALCRSASDQWHARSRKSHHADLGTEGCGNLGFCGGWRGLLPRLPGAWDIFPSLSFYHISYSFHTCQAHAIHAIQAITCHYMPYTSSTNAVLHPFFMAISWVFIGFYHESRSRTGMHSMWSMFVFLGFSWPVGLRLQSWCNVFTLHGALSYLKNDDPTRVRFGQWISEMCLWTEWFHVGDLLSVSRLLAFVQCARHWVYWAAVSAQSSALGQFPFSKCGSVLGSGGLPVLFLQVSPSWWLSTLMSFATSLPQQVLCRLGWDVGHGWA